MFLSYFFAIEFDIKMLICFLVGIALGVIFFLMGFLFIIVKSIGSKDADVTTNDFISKDVKDMIYHAQKEYKDRSLRGNNSKTNRLFAISKDLIYAIMAKYYPNSKSPIYELSINEIVLLNINIGCRFDDVINRRGVRIIKKFRLSSIYDISQNLKNNENVYKDYDDKFKDRKKKFLNIINPAWWVKKSIIDKAINIVVDKLYLIIIAICGEEVYKIVSKKFDDEFIDTETESNVNEIIDSINEDLANVKYNIDVEGSDDLINLNNLRFKQKYLSLDAKEQAYESIFDENFKLKEKMRNEEKETKWNWNWCRRF